MKQLYFVFLVFLFGANTFGQETLSEFDARQKRINRNGMITLGSWATANMGYGFIASSQTTGTAKYFHQMNGMWNIVNFSLAGASLLSDRKKVPFGFQHSLGRQQKLEKTFLFNSALDLAYITAGAYLIERGKNQVDKKDMFTGYGQSLIVQGGFLLIFDVVMYGIHANHGKQLNRYTENITFGCTTNGIGISYHL